MTAINEHVDEPDAEVVAQADEFMAIFGLKRVEDKHPRFEEVDDDE